MAIEIAGNKTLATVVNSIAAANGLATLDGAGKVAAGQLPASAVGSFGGDGSLGNVTFSSNSTLTDGVYNFNNLTIDATFVILVDTYRNAHVKTRGNFLPNGKLAATNYHRRPKGGRFGNVGAITIVVPASNAETSVECGSSGGAGGGSGGQTTQVGFPGGSGSPRSPRLIPDSIVARGMSTGISHPGNGFAGFVAIPLNEASTDPLKLVTLSSAVVTIPSGFGGSYGLTAVGRSDFANTLDIYVNGVSVATSGAVGPGVEAVASAVGQVLVPGDTVEMRGQVGFVVATIYYAYLTLTRTGAAVPDAATGGAAGTTAPTAGGVGGSALAAASYYTSSSRDVEGYPAWSSVMRPGAPGGAGGAGVGNSGSNYVEGGARGGDGGAGGGVLVVEVLGDLIVGAPVGAGITASGGDGGVGATPPFSPGSGAGGGGGGGAGSLLVLWGGAGSNAGTTAAATVHAKITCAGGLGGAGSAFVGAGVASGGAGGAGEASHYFRVARVSV